MPTIVMHGFDRCSDESAELEALSNIVASFESFCLASGLEALRETRAPGGPLMKCPARPRTACAAYPVANPPHLKIIVKNIPSFFLAIAFAPRTLLKNIA